MRNAWNKWKSDCEKKVVGSAFNVTGGMTRQEDVHCVKQANATYVLMRYDTRNVWAAKVVWKRVATHVEMTIWFAVPLDRKDAVIGFALIVKMNMSDRAAIPFVIIIPLCTIGVPKTVAFVWQSVRARLLVF